MATKLKKLSYKQEKAKWYKKLKKSGFDDIERDEHRLKVNTLDRIGRNTFSRVDYTSDQLSQERLTAKIVHDAKQEYYYKAEHFLNSHKFESEKERVIWEYHANGLSIRDIVKVLNKAKIKADRYKVWKIIYKLAKEMKKKTGINNDK